MRMKWRVCAFNHPKVCSTWNSVLAICEFSQGGSINEMRRKGNCQHANEDEMKWMEVEWKWKWKVLAKALKIVFVLTIIPRCAICEWNNVKVSSRCEVKKWNEMKFVICEWNEGKWSLVHQLQKESLCIPVVYFVLKNSFCVGKFYKRVCAFQLCISFWKIVFVLASFTKDVCAFC